MDGSFEKCFFWGMKNERWKAKAVFEGSFRAVLQA